MAGLKFSGELPDDITILNSHYFPESMAQSTVSFIRRSRECQERLKELLAVEKRASGHSFQKEVQLPRENTFSEGDAQTAKSLPYLKHSTAAGICSFQEFFQHNREIHSNAILNLIKMLLF